jgi:hypothetical protein
MRRRSVQKFPHPASEHALLAAMQGTPRANHLPLVIHEAAIVEDFWTSLKLTLVKPLQRREVVLEHLSSCIIFHFSGCARSDRVSPSRSLLFLEDWQSDPLTVADLRDLRLQGELAVP